MPTVEIAIPQIGIMRYLASLSLALLIIATSTTVQAECGVSSVYWEGSRTATGERFNPHSVLVAHRTRPLNSYVHVRNMRTGKEITVRVGDRGPYHGARILDLSLGAAKLLGVSGLAYVCID